ncbi:hypothetical protein GEMRC1_011307 [Eukaryota sp. GEM-RC1]
MSQAYKGSHGKIGVFGGSYEYCGASFFAAMSALKYGADLSSIICSPDAAIPIKSYSPDLIVFPSLYDIPACMELIPRFDSIVIGPGAGRSESAVASMKQIIPKAIESAKVVVLDGDALWLLSQDKSILPSDFGSCTVVLTPNFMELTRLCHTYLDRTPRDVSRNFSGKLGKD